MKAYRVICSVNPDVETIVAAVSAGKATACAYANISDMYRDVHFGQFKTRRAPEFDKDAAATCGRAVIGWHDRALKRESWGCCEVKARGE